MACCLNDSKPSPNPVVIYCQLYISMMFCQGPNMMIALRKIKQNYLLWGMAWNVTHFVSTQIFHQLSLPDAMLILNTCIHDDKICLIFDLYILATTSEWWHPQICWHCNGNTIRYLSTTINSHYTCRYVMLISANANYFQITLGNKRETFLWDCLPLAGRIHKMIPVHHFLACVRV